MHASKILLLLMGAVMCMGATSCKRLNRQAVEKEPRGDGSQRQREGATKHVLSKEQIIKAANAEVRRRGNHLDIDGAFYDEGNYYWRARSTAGLDLTGDEAEAVILDRWPQLKGRDYQGVSYWPSPAPKGYPPNLAGPLYILVDRNTGEVLLVQGFPS